MVSLSDARVKTDVYLNSEIKEKTKKIIQDARDGKDMTKITLEELKR